MVACVQDGLVTGVVFACALAIACLFSILLLPRGGGAEGREIYPAAPVGDFVSPLKGKCAQCKTQND